MHRTSLALLIAVLIALLLPAVQSAREAARRVVRDGHRAGEVITRIRSFLKKTETEKSSVDINQIIGEVAGLTRDEATRSNVMVRMELAHNLPPAAGERVQLQQVILNLMMNGIEAMACVINFPTSPISQVEASRTLSVRKPALKVG